MSSTTLTKSRFKVALDCPRKLTYAADPRYPNTMEEDEFLEALANGGHQVGALAKLMYPNGVEVTGRSVHEQIENTRTLIAQDSVTLFEPTFRFGNLLIRVDILQKGGGNVQLIEVKSKSAPRGGFRGARGGIKSEWRPYLADVAFQYYVLSQCRPPWSITPYLALIDRDAICDVESLATRIAVSRTGSAVRVTVDPGLPVELQNMLLMKMDVTDEVNEILGGTLPFEGLDLPFAHYVERVASVLGEGKTFAPSPSSACKRCEFCIEPTAISAESHSGWAECMAAHRHQPVEQSREATIFGLNNDRKSASRLQIGEFLLRDLTSEFEEERDAITLSHRHFLQTEEARGQLPTPVLRSDALKASFDRWKYPLHIIDFETARSPLPYFKGEKPNRQILFQYSHHVLEQDGRLCHRSQRLLATPGVMPNFEVLRSLQESLGGDAGTVIHWWTHERNVLTDLRKQLSESEERDKVSLIDFIDSLIVPGGDGASRLQDLGLPLVSKMAFFPGTGGRSSIKRVLPAVLQQSSHVRAIYREPVYGTPIMPSLNFQPPQRWILEGEEGSVKNPYELLDPLFADLSLMNSVRKAEVEEDGESAFIRNGGAAMIAFGQLQRRDLAAQERERYESQLLRYCELDTLAMVMVYQALRHWTQN